MAGLGRVSQWRDRLFHLGERDTLGHATRDRSLNNVDLRLVRGPASGAFDYEVEGIHQSGQTSTSLAPGAPRVAVSAWFAHAGRFRLHFSRRVGTASVGHI
jgi:hypothetical protein